MEKVAHFCNKLHINITEENIDRAHRVGKPSVNKSQAIIVRFKSHSDKIAVLSKRWELYSSIFYVNEDLTSQNHQLLFAAKKDCNNVVSSWSKDGKIFVKRASDDKIFRITSKDDLLMNNLSDFAL